MSATLLFRDREMAPRELDEAVRRVAGGLERLGIGEGDVVCIMLHNAPAFSRDANAIYSQIVYAAKGADVGVADIISEDYDDVWFRWICVLSH